MPPDQLSPIALPPAARMLPVDERVHARLLAGSAEGPVDDEALAELVRREGPLLNAGAVTTAVARVRARIDGVGALEPLLVDPAVNDVLVNGPGPVWIERAGQLEPTDVVVDRSAIDLLIERVVAPLGLRADRSTPIVDARLPDGSRVHVVLPPPGDRRAVRHHPALRGHGPAARQLLPARDRRPPDLGRRRRPEHGRVRCHQQRQDHAAQRPVPAPALR